VYGGRLREAPEIIRGIRADDWREHLRHERLIGDWIALALDHNQTGAGD
jgi:hypothetical protein